METYNPNFALLDSQNEFFSEENYEVSDTAWELLHGAIDTHVHSNPTRDDGFVLDDFELVREYDLLPLEDCPEVRRKGRQVQGIRLDLLELRGRRPEPGSR